MYTHKVPIQLIQRAWRKWQDFYRRNIKEYQPSNNPFDKNGDKNRKKGDETKSEDKNNSNTGTAVAHVGETIMPQDSNTPLN